MHRLPVNNLLRLAERPGSRLSFASRGSIPQRRLCSLATACGYQGPSPRALAGHGAARGLARVATPGPFESGRGQPLGMSRGPAQSRPSLAPPVRLGSRGPKLAVCQRLLYGPQIAQQGEVTSTTASGVAIRPCVPRYIRRASPASREATLSGAFVAARICVRVCAARAPSRARTKPRIRQQNPARTVRHCHVAPRLFIAAADSRGHRPLNFLVGYRPASRSERTANRVGSPAAGG